MAELARQIVYGVGVITIFVLSLLWVYLAGRMLMRAILKTIMDMPIKPKPKKMEGEKRHG